MNKEYAQSKISRILDRLETEFGGKEPIKPEITREASMKFVIENLSYLKHATNKQLADVVAVIEEIKRGRK